MEEKRLRRRLVALVVLLCAVLAGYSGVLYDLQVVRGEEFAAQAKRKIPVLETVDAARGILLDRHGNVLVDNRVEYQITLDTKRMGAARNDVLLKLIGLCRAADVRWADSLPISASAPFYFTETGNGGEVGGNFLKLADQLKWSRGTAETAMAAMEQYFSIPETLSAADRRALAGILYELTLRTRELVWSEYILASEVDIDLISAIKEHGLPGVRVVATTKRQYQTEYAAHILGRVGLMSPNEWETYKTLGYTMNESVGKDGVERAFESYLRGERGTRAVETDAEGRVVGETWITAPRPGDNVTLTIDLALQQRLEDSLAETIPALRESQENKEARGGAAVVMDMTGGVLALASYPTFDLANFGQVYNVLLSDPMEPMFNRALQGLYSPGSTYKMVTAVGGLEEEIITPATRILDTGRYTYYDDYQPMCWLYRGGGGTHGWETLSDAITDSCNVYFFDVGRRLGISRLEEYARKFGLGEKTGIELPESSGVVSGPEYTESRGQYWYEGNTLPAAIGQENNQFTPLQLANYIATLVNGGTRYQAHLLKSVSSYDFSEQTHTETPQVAEQIDLAPEHLEAIKRGMLGSAGSSTVARYFAGLDVTVGAKTGSAQVSSASESNAVFVCFAPYENPQIAIAIVVEHGGSGYQLAEIAADVISFYFNAQSAPETIPAENELIR